MRSWVLALALGACGDVNKVPDVVVPDAFQADSPVAPACQPGETVCNGVTCADLMADELNCGSCNNPCAPTQTCHNGTCFSLNATCNKVRELDATAADGIYFNPQTNQNMYCDFTNSTTYLGFGMGPHNSGFSGYTLMSTAELNDAKIRKAFIALYNAESGLVNLAPGFSDTNCCFKAAPVAAGQMLLLGGVNHFLYPASVGTDTTRCNGPYTESRYRFFVNTESTFSPVPLPDNYFDTHFASTGGNCSDGGNPGIFMRRKLSLD